jgi:hypothetical protein
MPMKTISYRGGIISFRVPAAWTEAYGSDGGAVFSPDDSNNVGLYVNVLTAKPPGVADAEALRQALAASGELDAAPEWLGNGNAILRRRLTTRGGTAREVHSWTIANAVPPDTVRVATFTLNSAGLVSEDLLGVLDREIQATVFIDLTADQVREAVERHSGRRDTRPWWKFW